MVIEQDAAVALETRGSLRPTILNCSKILLDLWWVEIISAKMCQPTLYAVHIDLPLLPRVQIELRHYLNQSHSRRPVEGLTKDGVVSQTVPGYADRGLLTPLQVSFVSEALPYERYSDTYPGTPVPAP